MNRLFEARQIRPVIDKVFPFDQVKEAYKHLVSQKHIGKVVIKVSAWRRDALLKEINVPNLYTYILDVSA